MAAWFKLPLRPWRLHRRQGKAGQSGAFWASLNHNSPAQFVISGESPPGRASALVKEAQGSAVTAGRMSGAFHSR
jgi:hypothetical protein